MGKLRGLIRISSFWLVGLSLVACAPFFGSGAWHPLSGTRIVQPDLGQSIGYYENAVTAINNRHYALALEYLQAARNQKPNDVRVLTAFGVIYDKLGRFDLSARFYAEAAALDPKSRIIAADMDYSRRLQGISANPETEVADAGMNRDQGSWPRTVATAEETRAPSPSIATSQTDRGSARAAGREEPAKVANNPASPAAKTVFLTGHPLAILDASGRSDTDASVRAYLAGLGWSVAKGDGSKLPARPDTVIVYRDSMVTAAKALARTLALPMHLTASDGVQGIQLVLGADISGDLAAARLQQTRQRQLALAASKPKTRE